ncbi:AAA-like domain protein [Polystyrenella longa]|uniref:AAA-like domain protein n=1 Tax=Polystyrenella longa TaxID=2528007 RepID=A0A518CJZ5_9PLAN|nr:ATP-binding protein [Polystyrenella longa]QDU79494.1 AAA-like domain protein [Polystyrenella longa]
MQDYEKLSAFYLGRGYDLEQGALTEDLLLYDSKDLTTHAVCVGMTGSGKTGLCLSLLEEAAIDGIPAIAIDPKGDLGNLFLTFPDLAPDDFQPWVDPAEATRKGMTVEQYAEKTANTWREGLASWGQEPERIARFRDAVDMAIYTPGSNAGMPLTVLRSFAAPAVEIREDSEALAERVSTSTSGLLALLGIKADPIQSREHILIANILTDLWKQGKSLDIAGLIGAIQAPPFERVGIIDLETFFPADDRMDLAMTLNNLLASPTFANWLEGESLNIKNLLYTSAGKPRLSIISIAHLSDAERMFFVTILLNEVLAWVRSQPGTSSLRALLYMDEVFGYFPPTANPPSKKPMLTLLKQARAYGLGVVLATQNPVDLDYKGLSNTGTWFLGRLQTERDKMRVLEGLEGASNSVGSSFDRQRMERMLAGLGSRVFLMNNVHEDGPVVFQTRWALSYLRGPLTRQQIATLMDARKQGVIEAKAAAEEATPAVVQEQLTEQEAAPDGTTPPMIPKDVPVAYVLTRTRPEAGERIVYRPALLGRGRLHFKKATCKVDTWEDRSKLAALRNDIPHDIWEDASSLPVEGVEIRERAEPEVTFSPLPAELLRIESYKGWEKDLKTSLYQSEEMTLFKSTELKVYSQPGETEGDFRISLRHQAQEERDLRLEKLRKKYGSKTATLQSRIQTAEAAVERESSQATRATLDSAISFGSTLLGAIFGRKLASKTNVSKASTSMKSAGRAMQQRSDVARAEEKVKKYQQQLAELEEEFELEIESLENKLDVDQLDVEEIQVSPLKSDIETAPVTLVWLPWRVDSAGIAEPFYDIKQD